MKLELQERLLEYPYAKRAGSKQIVMRCIFCGDSRKHTNSSHMSIKIDITDEEPILFNCFLCNIGGVLTPSILKEFDIHDLELSSKLLSYNTEVVKKINKKIGIKDNDIVLRVPKYKEVPNRVLEKQAYIENRLGITIPIEELYSLKTVFNISDFLLLNNIKPNAKEDKIRLINDDYVGFMSCRNEFLVCRNTVSNSNKRYEKYPIFYSLDNTRQFYSIPNNIDLMSPDDTEINVAEGVFDILGIYYHVKGCDKQNKVYAAVCGSGFMNVIKYFINLGIFGNNVTLNIYSDSDKDISYYKYIKKDLGVWFRKTNVFYNLNDHDYGVHKDKIHLILGGT